MSVNLAAAFRLSAIYGVANTLTKPLYSGLLLLSQFLYAVPTLISGLISVQDRDAAVNDMIQVISLFIYKTVQFLALSKHDKIFL